jgi:hypothetical protein
MTLPRTTALSPRRLDRRFGLGAVLAACVMAPLSAQPVPVGEAFDVNQFDTGTQARPAVRMANSGRTLFTWQSEGQDGSDRAVVLRRMTPGGEFFDEFVANQLTVGDQDSPNLAMNASGDFTVTWLNATKDGRAIAFRSTVFDDSSLTAERQANAAAGNMLESAVCRFADDTTVVVWPNLLLRFRRFAADGNALTGESLFPGIVGPTGVGVACLSDRRFVVTWRADDSDGPGVFALLVDADGDAMGKPFQVTEDPEHRQFQPRIASDGDSRFVVAWLEEDVPQVRLEMRRFFVDPADSTPTAFTGDQTILELTSVNLIVGNLDMASDGAFVLAYDQGDGVNSVRAFEFTRTGELLPGGPAIPVEPGTFPTSVDAGVGLREYLLAWEDAGVGKDIRARRYVRRAVFSDDFETGKIQGWSGVVD